MHESACENIVCVMAAILSKGRCVKYIFLIKRIHLLRVNILVCITFAVDFKMASIKVCDTHNINNDNPTSDKS